MNRPSNLSEWVSYIETLPSDRLYSQAIAANTHTFVRELQAEGQTVADVENILVAFVKRLRALGMPVPEGGAFNLWRLAIEYNVPSEPSYSEEEVAFLSQEPSSSPPDDLEDFELTAGLEI